MERRNGKRVVFGLILVLSGVVLLARQLDLTWAPNLRLMWPVVFYILAAGHLASSRGPLLTAEVVWFLFLGTIFLLHTHDVMSLRVSWPLFIVVGGVSLLMDALVSQSGGRKSAQPHNGGELR